MCQGQVPWATSRRLNRTYASIQSAGVFSVVVVRALVTALDARPERFNTVRVDVAPYVFACAVLDPIKTEPVQVAVARKFVRANDYTGLHVFVNYDILAEANGTTLAIEAKGGTSSKPGTKRYGKFFTRNQKLAHVAKAFYTAATVVSAGKHRAAIALPSDAEHRQLVDNIAPVIEALHRHVLCSRGFNRVCFLEARNEG